MLNVKSDMNEVNNDSLHNVSGWFLVEITKPMSTTFKKGMNAWCKYTSNRNDFKLKTLAEDYEQGFGFAYKPHFKICH